jgi:hypothetical protein
MKIKYLVPILLIVFIFSFVGCKTTTAETTAAAETGAAIAETTTLPVQIKGDYNIGDTGPAGGFIFYVNPNYESDGWKYLEAATSDFSGDRNGYYILWYNGTNIKTGAREDAIGTGMSNTQKIINIQGEGIYAAKLCSDLTQGGYSDWFMPSIDELNLLYENLYLKGIGGFKPEKYWSSSECSEDGARYQDFSNGYEGIFYDKLNNRRVRAVRAFTTTVVPTTEAETTEAVTTIAETTAPSAVVSDYNIGDTGPAGGLIFYDKGNNNDGWRYLEAAPSDFPDSIPWYNVNYVVTGVTATAIGSGMSNTQKIVNILGSGSYAAKLCDDLTLNGFDDWFLPSLDELNLMFENLYLHGLGSFAYKDKSKIRDYWSSSETSYGYVWFQYFVNGGQYNDNGELNNRWVRAVRTF